jgi:hypothetical protein
MSRIDERLKWIEIRGTNGLLHDPADGAPGSRLLPGRDPGVDQPLHRRLTPRPRRRNPGVPGLLPGRDSEVDQPLDQRQDATTPPTAPPLTGFYSDGTPKWIEHWTNGELVSEESFPPPTGEA